MKKRKEVTHKQIMVKMIERDISVNTTRIGRNHTKMVHLDTQLANIKGQHGHYAKATRAHLRELRDCRMKAIDKLARSNVSLNEILIEMENWSE